VWLSNETLSRGDAAMSRQQTSALTSTLAGHKAVATGSPRTMAGVARPSARFISLHRTASSPAL
jgi:hypothetical protein